VKENQQMYSPSLSGGAANSESGSRIFVYEVEGMRQSQATDQISNPIRRSGSVFISVPYDRMNQEMRRIARMGGKIISIRPSNSAPETKWQSRTRSRATESEIWRRN
jgi:ferredoxin--NADP+ reductase